ncbi:hypothetical protein NDU88_001548 [Pleurodeles waltl]|uniref:Uncharacterized protein n=1 Tax=Pleurodeles waltl TaxID=8319 RepID=A0AAV7KPR5_PLEWA|nr:hypothetical protein NDU88_001548 [Pleurodeles waltl]
MAASRGQRATEDEVAQEWEPSLGSITAAIRDIWVSISQNEPKLDAKTVEFNMLQADFRKISEKVKVQRLTLRDYCRSQRGSRIRFGPSPNKVRQWRPGLRTTKGGPWNNIRIVWEGMKGQSVDLCRGFGPHQSKTKEAV